MSMTLKTVVAVAGVVVATQAVAQVTFYEREDFRGRSFTTDRPVYNMDRAGFDDNGVVAVQCRAVEHHIGGDRVRCGAFHRVRVIACG